MESQDLYFIIYYVAKETPVWIYDLIFYDMFILWEQLNWEYKYFIGVIRVAISQSTSI